VVLKALLRDFPETVRLTFRHVPGEDGRPPGLAHRAALAAGEQGRFWEMHDMLLANRDRRTPADMLGMARQLDLDLSGFAAALERTAWDDELEDRVEGRRIGLKAGPVLFVNGERVTGPLMLDTLRELVKNAGG